jgi:hypothetical protein
MDVNERINNECADCMFPSWTFVTGTLELIHIRQKQKIALKIAVKVASVNGPLIQFKLQFPAAQTALKRYLNIMLAYPV